MIVLVFSIGFIINHLLNTTMELTKNNTISTGPEFNTFHKGDELIKNTNENKKFYDLFIAKSSSVNLDKNSISQETVERIVRENGLMIGFLREFPEFLNNGLYETAVAQNCLAYGLIPKEFRTLEIQQIAFQQDYNKKLYEYYVPPFAEHLLKINIKFESLMMIFDTSKKIYLDRLAKANEQ